MLQLPLQAPRRRPSPTRSRRAPQNHSACRWGMVSRPQVLCSGARVGGLAEGAGLSSEGLSWDPGPCWPGVSPRSHVWEEGSAQATPPAPVL